jgi:hypothetical protein
MSTKVKFYVPELDNVMLKYDSVWVQRSTDAPPVTNEVDITADVAAAAVLTGTEEGPFALSGKTLTFKVNGIELTVTFTSPDPVSQLTAISEINAALIAASLAATAVDNAGKVELQTTNTGTHYTLEIISGTAMAELGFTAGQKDNGEDEHVLLVAGLNSYEYDDGSGQASYYYRTRYYSTTTHLFSGWSDWIQGTTGAAIDASLLIVGKVSLAELDGTALANRKIIIRNVYEPSVAGGYGMLGGALELKTDGTGKAETTLVRGSLLDVVFSGTSIVRRIRVPSTGTEFDLLDNSLVVDDAFNIQVPDLPYAPRRS